MLLLSGMIATVLAVSRHIADHFRNKPKIFVFDADTY